MLYPKNQCYLTKCCRYLKTGLKAVWWWFSLDYKERKIVKKNWDYYNSLDEREKEKFREDTRPQFDKEDK